MSWRKKSTMAIQQSWCKATKKEFKEKWKKSTSYSSFV